MINILKSYRQNSLNASAIFRILTKKIQLSQIKKINTLTQVSILFKIWGQHWHKVSSYSGYFLFFFDPIICWNLQKVRETVLTKRLLLSDNARKFGCKPNKKKQAFPWTMNQNFGTLTYLSMKTRLKDRVLLHSQTSQLLVIHKYRHKKVCSQGCCIFWTESFCLNVWSLVTVSVI